MLDNDPKPLEMLIPGLIPKTSIVTISAPGGTSKSYLCLALAINLATNTPFLGKFQPGKRRRVLIVNGEDDDAEVHRRMKNILAAVQADLSAEEKEEMLDRLAKRLRIAFTHNEPDFVLYSTKTFGENSRRISDFCTIDLKFPVDLIILDNLTVMHDADHNSADLASGFMRELKRIHKDTAATIILIAHTNKSSQDGNLYSRLASASVLGSTAFSNNSRLVISMTQVTANDGLDFGKDIATSDVVAMKISKANSGNLIKDILFLKRNHDGVLEYIEPIVVDPRHESYQVLSVIKNQPELNKTMLVEKLRNDCKMSKNAAFNLIERVLADKLIEQRETGVNNGKCFKITRLGEELYNEVASEFEQEEPDSSELCA